MNVRMWFSITALCLLAAAETHAQHHEFPTDDSSAVTPSSIPAEPIHQEASSTVTPLLDRLQRLKKIDFPTLLLVSPLGGYYAPSGFGGSRGNGGLGIGLQHRARFSTNPDGAAGVSMGLGDPHTLGFDIGVAILDLRRNPDGGGGLGHRGSFSFKVHRRLPGGFAVASGAENIMNWGGTDVPPSWFTVASKQFRLRSSSDAPFSRGLISLGLGTGRFRTARSIRTGGAKVGIFGSTSINLIPQVSGFVEWSGQDMGMGLTLVPFRSIPLVLTPAFTDLTGRTGSGPRLVLGIGYGFTLN